MPTKLQLAFRAVSKADDESRPVVKFEPVRDDFGRVNVAATMVKAMQGGPDAQKAFLQMVDQDTGTIKE